MRKILVTAISGNIGNGILKILKAEEQMLYGCDVNQIAVGMDLVEEFWQCRYAVEEGYLDELLEKCTQFGITHLIPVNEREIEVIGKQRKRFEDIHVKVVIQSQHILDICLDKLKTAEFLMECGIKTPATYPNIESINDKNGLYICKPRKSNGSKNVFIFRPKDKIDERIDDTCIVQEYIESEEEYTIGVFRQKETVNVIAFLRKLEHGYSSQVELIHDNEIVLLAKKVAGLLQAEGYFNIQLRKKDGYYYIFEINPRISGTVRFRHMLGFMDVLWWLDLLDGKIMEPFFNRYHKALGIRELNEKFLILK